MAELPIWHEALKPVVTGMDSPLALHPPIFLPSGDTVHSIPVCVLRFTNWKVTHPDWERDKFVDDFGKQSAAWVDLNGEHLFAELGLLRLLERKGWSGRWVNPYAARAEGGVAARDPKMLTSWHPDLTRAQQAHVPIEGEPRELLTAIARRNAKFSGRARYEKDEWYGGCWDVFAWKDDRFVFVESKYKDLVKSSQLGWLRAALDLDDERLRPDSFVLARWHYA